MEDSVHTVWPLSAHLEHQPLLDVVLLWACRVRQLRLLIVCLDQVLDDGSGFPEPDTGIGIIDGWDTSVGIDLLVDGCMQVFHWCDVDLIRYREFLENHHNFVRIGTAGWRLLDILNN